MAPLHAKSDEKVDDSEVVSLANSPFEMIDDTARPPCCMLGDGCTSPDHEYQCMHFILYGEDDEEESECDDDANSICRMFSCTLDVACSACHARPAPPLEDGEGSLHDATMHAVWDKLLEFDILVEKIGVEAKAVDPVVLRLDDLIPLSTCMNESAMNKFQLHESTVVSESIERVGVCLSRFEASMRDFVANGYYEYYAFLGRNMSVQDFLNLVCMFG